MNLATLWCAKAHKLGCRVAMLLRLTENDIDRFPYLSRREHKFLRRLLQLRRGKLWKSMGARYWCPSNRVPRIWLATLRQEMQNRGIVLREHQSCARF